MVLGSGGLSGRLALTIGDCQWYVTAQSGWEWFVETTRTPLIEEGVPDPAVVAGFVV